MRTSVKKLVTAVSTSVALMGAGHAAAEIQAWSDGICDVCGRDDVKQGERQTSLVLLHEAISQAEGHTSKKTGKETMPAATSQQIEKTVDWKCE